MDPIGRQVGQKPQGQGGCQIGGQFAQRRLANRKRLDVILDRLGGHNPLAHLDQSCKELLAIEVIRGQRAAPLGDPAMGVFLEELSIAESPMNEEMQFGHDHAVEEEADVLDTLQGSHSRDLDEHVPRLLPRIHIQHEDFLVGAQRQVSIHDRNRDGDGEQGGADVRGPIAVVASKMVFVFQPLWRNPLEQVLQVNEHAGLVLYHQDGAGRVLVEDEGGAFQDLGLLEDSSHPVRDVDDVEIAL